MTTRKQLAEDLAAEKGISKREAMRQVKALLDAVEHTTTIVSDETPRVVDLTKSEFERKLEAEVEAEAITGKRTTRCLTCGNLWRYCTCGGKSPLDCEKCKAGKGKGEILGRKGNITIRGDRLCDKHVEFGRIALNRKEKRQAIHGTRGTGKVARAKRLKAKGR